MILSDVCKNYGQKPALKHLNFELREGEITAVLGESGAGKTTLLNVIAGLTSYEGEIDGKSGKKPKRREDCSYLFQEATLLPNLTAEGNLKFVLPKSEWSGIGETLARVGLGGREKSYPHELSGGEKQRVAIARAFLNPHKLLLMDEPFASLDPSLKRGLIALVRELWEQSGNTVVFVTHDVWEAATLARRAVVLRKGELAAETETDRSHPYDLLRLLCEDCAE